MKVKTIASVKNWQDKTVLVRVDFNVPLQGGKIKDDFKIKASLELIKFLIDKQARILLLTHLGWPQSGGAADRRKFSVKIIAARLTKLLGKRVLFLNQPLPSAKLQTALTKLKNGQVALLENVRFYRGETVDDAKFAKQLADLADLYINNAFASCHRQHASVAAVKKYLPSYAGPLVVEELINLQKILKPKRPLVAIVGGAKIETKMALLKNLLKRADVVLVGGALANNFLAAKGYRLGRSLTSAAGIKLAKKSFSRKLLLPVDAVVLSRGRVQWRPVNKIKRDEAILDIGPATMKLYAAWIKKAQTIFWNGPMGKFEDDKFRYGTLFVGRLVASRASGQAFGLVGGGETVEALKLTKMAEDVDWISTGGGASLAYLSGVKLPGLKGLVS